MPSLPSLRAFAAGRRLALALVGGLALVGVAGGVSASPPEPGPPPSAHPTPAPDQPDPRDQPIAAAPAAPEPAGYWLSLELIGPRGAQIDAAEALRVEPVVDALPRGGSPPPGELVGRVATRAQALAWIDAYAFDAGALGFEGTSDRPAPLPGGALLEAHGVHLTALVVTAASPSGGTESPTAWPPAAALPTPPSWRQATLAVARAPVFAAPSPTLPPAAERYRVVAREHAVWQLGALERCTEAGACLRWAQILVREGDRWYGGWIPAAQVVAEGQWRAVAEDRRFAVLASHRSRDRVGYVLVEQHGQRWAPPLGLEQAHVGTRWPAASLEQIGEQLIVLVDGQPLTSVELRRAPAPAFVPG